LIGGTLNLRTLNPFSKKVKPILQKRIYTILKELHITISMDGKGRAADNAFIERWFRTLKQKYVYLNPAGDGLELYAGIDQFVKQYNRRRHQGIKRRKPIDLYRQAA
jgi:putative transposase